MYRILLVDDEILVRDAIKENIDWKSLDCELVGDCENGKQAAEFVKGHPVDIVLTDILMPYMDGMELSKFLHDNYPDVVIVIFSGFGEFEYAKKAIQYGVSEYLLKPVTAMELTGVINKMKEKVDQLRSEKNKMNKLTENSEKYRKNAQVIRSKNMEALVNCTTDVSKSIQRLAEMGIDISAISYRVALFDIDLYSGMYELDTEKQQESALMAFVLYNISDEIVTREEAGFAYQEGNNRVGILFQEKWSRNFTEKTREICTVVSQESIGAGIYSMWIQTDRIAADAKPGQFVSLYTNDKSKILPRPISLCEIDKENGRLHLVYRVTGQGTGTDEFSQMKAGDTIPVLGPLGNGFPVEKAEGKKVFLMGGGIGVPPILELAKQMKCEKKQIIAGYRDCHTFLREEFEAAGTLYIATEDGSVGTKGNVMDAIRENALEADVIYACGPTPMLRAIKKYAEENGIECYISLEERMACGIGACLACVCKSREKDAHSNVNNKRICKDGPVFLSTEVEI